MFVPAVAAVAAAITDFLGWVFFPTGPYFLPFMLTEIAGSVIFALFLYRARVTVRRVILSRFCIDFFVNIVLTTPIMMMYYAMVLGKYYAPLDLLRIVKNLALFPLEAVVLALFLRMAIPPLRSARMIPSGTDGLRFTRGSVITLCALVLAGALSVAGYSVYSYEHTSLSASYTAEQRYERNERLNAAVLERHPELAAEDTVTIVESAFPRFRGPEVTYSVAVYHSTSGDDALRGLSKSKARAEASLEHLFDAVITLDRDSDAVLAWSKLP